MQRIRSLFAGLVLLASLACNNNRAGVQRQFGAISPSDVGKVTLTRGFGQSTTTITDREKIRRLVEAFRQAHSSGDEASDQVDTIEFSLTSGREPIRVHFNSGRTEEDLGPEVAEALAASLASPAT